jgi:release factor glutamine methyltransferase
MGNTVGAIWRHAQTQLENVGLSPAPREAKQLLAHVLNCDENMLVLQGHQALTAAQTNAFEALLAQRLSGHPLAYVLGYTYFYGHKIAVDSRVLIPRPDTEVLVQAVLDNIPQTSSIYGAEVGVGSGAVIASLAHTLPNSRWLGTDISVDAARLARQNMAALGVETRVEIVAANLLPEGLPPLNVLVSNPPYISENEYKKLEDPVKNHEPKLALTGDEANPDGLMYYRRLAACKPLLVAGGLLALEIGHTQAADVCSLLTAAGWHNVRVITDLASRPRVVLALV